jgi:hypothetical protein
MGLVFAILCNVESGRWPAVRLAWLVPIFALWANLHGGALGGLATVALVLGGWCVVGRFGSPATHTALKCRTMAMLLAACALAVFVNPYGVALPLSWLEIMRLSLPEVIQEHKRLDLADPAAAMVLVLAAAYLLALGGVPWRAWRVTWLAPLVWLLLSLDRIRHAPLFALLAALALAEILPKSRWARWLVEHDYLPHPSDAKSSNNFAAAALCAIAVLAVASIVALGGPTAEPRWARLDPQLWPVKLLPQLEQIEHTENRRVFNTLDYGGFLIFHCPRLAVFIDDRCELFGDERLRAYALAEREAPEQLHAWQARYGFAHALVRRHSPFDLYLSRHAAWEQVGCDAAAALYRHRASPTGLANLGAAD